MSTTYFELIDLISRNLAGDFDREEDALRFLSSVLRSDDEDAVAGYGLEERTDSGYIGPAILGADLVQRVVEYAQSVTVAAQGRHA